MPKTSEEKIGEKIAEVVAVAEDKPLPEAKADERREQAIARFLDKYSPTDAKRSAMRKAFDSGISAEEFALQFRTKERLASGPGMVFLKSVREVIG